MASRLRLKRICDQPTQQDGTRFFVERLWPRGLAKSELSDVTWLREAVPSSDLQKWFHHDPLLWDEFRRRYFAELKGHRADLTPILAAARNSTVTLLYSSRDTEHNNAVALMEFLEQSLNPMEPASCLCLKQRGGSIAAQG